MPLEIRHLSLAELLSHSVPFHMARYQRHYEWGRKEMEQLLEDISDGLAVQLADPMADAYHFFNSVILFANPSGFLEVVDGQQRLTSITAMLAAARDIDGNAAMKEAIGNLITVSGQSRLTLHRGDNEFLRERIITPGGTDALEKMPKQLLPGAECLRINTLIARHWLQDMPAEKRAAFLRFALHKSRFIEIKVGTEDDAFRMFETVNSRGRSISSEDVLRYALVERATDDPAKRDEFLERWDAVEAELGPRGMKRFIAGWRVRAAKGSRMRQSLHRTVLASLKSSAEAFAFLDSELKKDVSIFRQISNADIEIADGPTKRRIDALLRSMALLDFDDWVPVASELIARGGGRPERVAADLARIERLAWYYYLCRDDKGAYHERRERFAGLMKTVTEHGTFEALPPRSLLSAEQCAKMCESVQARIEPKWVPLRSLLVRIEMALAGDGAAVIRGDLTIEHVLPLRPKTKAWFDLFTDDPAKIAEYAEQIGNLCLVSAELNTELGNQIYRNKRRILMEHKIHEQSPLAADIAKEQQWTPAVIDRRSKMLLDMFCKMFDLPKPTS